MGNRPVRKQSSNNMARSQGASPIKEAQEIRDMPPDLRFFHRFKKIIAKKIRQIVENTTLQKAHA